MTAFDFQCRIGPRELDLTRVILYRWPDTGEQTLCRTETHQGQLSFVTERYHLYQLQIHRIAAESLDAANVSNWTPELGEEVVILGDLRAGRNAAKGTLRGFTAYSADVETSSMPDIVSVPFTLIFPAFAQARRPY